MKSDNIRCFVLMPFSPHLKYFFIFYKHHIETKFVIDCERADDQYLTVPLLDKIKKQIQNADFIIADCTGKNANVFYELGMAHASQKDVILITNDDLKETPTDIRHYEFIKYDLNSESEFLKKLDNAINNIISKRYDEYYRLAKNIFDEFKLDTDHRDRMVDKEKFIELLIERKQTGSLPPIKDKERLKPILLPLIVDHKNDLKLMKQMSDWTF